MPPSPMSDTLQALREELREQREAIRKSHERGLAGSLVSAKLASLTDLLIQRLFNATLDQLEPEQAARLRSDVTLVGLGSYARRQCSPYSDVDLMILYQNQTGEEIAAQLRPLTQGIFDIGLQLGHSVRTPVEAIQLARADTVICTSLVDARLVLGDRDLFETFRASFETMMRKGSKTICRTFLDIRVLERDQYGETVFLLEPHVKRSRGGLRDLNLLRWLGFAEQGISDPDRLHLAGAMSKIDLRRLHSAMGFLLRLRNEMHFHAGSAHDLLHRAEQLRVAEWLGYKQKKGLLPAEQLRVAEWLGYKQKKGLLPVEQFMRDYFRHANHLWQIVRRRDASLQIVSRVTRVLDPMLGKTIDGDYRVGMNSVSATKEGLVKLKKDLGAVLKLVELTAREGKHLDHATWSAVLLSVADFTEAASDTVNRQFYELLADPETVGEVLRVLHELGYLEKIVPAMKHVRCLLQFNQYHKYTVDEHSLRAVSKAAHFAKREDTLGEAYREIADKRVLHLALLLHDLGKGYEEDHSEVGKRIAAETTALLKIDEQAAEDVIYLVHQHLVMAHLTFRRDTSDERLLENFARDVGSLERLRMLYVLTCADLAAVGPGVLNDWKVEILADVFNKTSRYYDSKTGPVDEIVTQETRLAAHRDAVMIELTQQQQQDPWFTRQVEAFSPNFLASHEFPTVIDTLCRFRALFDGKADVWCVYSEEAKTLKFTAGIDQGTGRGVFSSMAGALSKMGMQIHSAGTDLLSEGLLMLQYVVTDSTSLDEPTAERLQQVCQELITSVDSDEPPKFPEVWGAKQAAASIQLSALPDEVRIDIEQSEDYTIVEVFTFDRRALLYKLARKLHDLKLIISHAKIGTYLDQVVDVFYVTDRDRNKVTDPPRLETLREELLEVICWKKKA